MQIPSGMLNPHGNIEERARSCPPLHALSSVDTEHETIEVDSVTDFFYDNRPEHMSYTIAIEQGYYYCRLHPEKNANLESIEHHHIKVQRS